MGWFKKLCKQIFVCKTKKLDKSVNNSFYCELDGNFAHDKCKEQCNHCNKEVENFKLND